MSVPRAISDVARDLGLAASDLVPVGANVAKVRLDALQRPARGEGATVLVSAMTPSRYGEGKTLTSIALSMALNALGKRTVVCLREPSLGPVFGKKGGGTGGGRAQVVPADDINLHFTGDLHAVTAANNLLAALIDNELHFNGTARFDPNRISWQRVLDVNDRALRRIVTGLGVGSVPRESGFDITAASEVMAVLCLAQSLSDLEARLAKIVIGRARSGDFVTAGELSAAAAMTALLKNALLPNLVQTSEGTPALIHGGPFANIAHGCSSVLATRLGTHYADRVVTEAGFGFDLGGEKFLHIKHRAGGPWPRCVVLVISLRALRVQGGAKTSKAAEADAAALERGLANLEHHLSTVGAFGLRAVVAVNVFDHDIEEDLARVEAHCRGLGVPVARHRGHALGSEGTLDLARRVEEVIAEGSTQPVALYELEDEYEDKLRAIARTVYGADDVRLSAEARRRLKRYKKYGYTGLPICMAKTPLSLSDDPSKVGRPRGFDITVQNTRLSAGAGFLVALLGEVQTMPGLPRQPAAFGVRMEGDRIRGLMQND
ncbi:MAG: formate--tetrahydrofolate ligase [Planctomycetota bacterium]|nr:MAG: formate--tetrahydrofolate ligase [Planctomycetota bacterium]